MDDIKVISGVPDNEIHVLSCSVYSEAPLKPLLAPGAFLQSRKCSKNHQNWWKSTKIAYASIWAAPFSTTGASMTRFDFLALAWPWRLSSTSLDVCEPNKSLWRLLKLCEVSKKLQKCIFLLKNPQFSRIMQNIGAFCLWAFFCGYEASLVLLKACGWSRGASEVAKVRRSRPAPFESSGIAVNGHENRRTWWNFTKIQSTPRAFKKRRAPPAHFRNLRGASTSPTSF